VQVIAAALRQLLQDMRSQKLRTFLTTFGIIWGTASVSLLLAFGGGLHKQLVKTAAGLGDRIVIAWPSRTSIPYEGLGKGRRIRATEEDLAAVTAAVPDLVGLSGEYGDSMKIHYGEKTLMADVAGVNPPFGGMRNLIPQEGGRFLNDRDMDDRRRVVFLGDQLAKDIFGEEKPVGKTLMVLNSPFLVIGVLVPKEQDSSYKGRDKDQMWIPATTFRALTGAKYVDNIIYRGKTADDNPRLTEEVRRTLARRLKFDPKDEEALQVWDTTEMFAFFDAFMLGFKLFLGIVGSLTLLVGGIGVSNIMNVVVEERTREIGIKVALGARRWTILVQFLLETLFLTAVGGALGMVLTWLICAAFPVLGFTEYVGVPTLSPPVAAMTACLLGLVGLVAGYFPAKEAADLDPVVAMKL